MKFEGEPPFRPFGWQPTQRPEGLPWWVGDPSLPWSCIFLILIVVATPNVVPWLDGWGFGSWLGILWIVVAAGAFARTVATIVYLIRHPEKRQKQYQRIRSRAAE